MIVVHEPYVVESMVYTVPSVLYHFAETTAPFPRDTEDKGPPLLLSLIQRQIALRCTIHSWYISLFIASLPPFLHSFPPSVYFVFPKPLLTFL